MDSECGCARVADGVICRLTPLLPFHSKHPCISTQEGEEDEFGDGADGGAGLRAARDEDEMDTVGACACCARACPLCWMVGIAIAPARRVAGWGLILFPSHPPPPPSYTPPRQEDAEAAAQRLSVHEVDAFWLQRQLGKYYEDANQSAKLAEEVLQVRAWAVLVVIG